MSADNVTLLAFAAEHCAVASCCRATAAGHLAATTVDRYLLPAWCSAANPMQATAAVARRDKKRWTETEGHRTITQTLLRTLCGQCQ